MRSAYHVAALDLWNTIVELSFTEEQRGQFSDTFGAIKPGEPMLRQRAMEAARYIKDPDVFSMVPWPGFSRTPPAVTRLIRALRRNDPLDFHPTLPELLGRRFRFTGVRGHGIRDDGPEVEIVGQLKRIGRNSVEIDVEIGAHESDKQLIVTSARDIPLDGTTARQRARAADHWSRIISNMVVTTATGEKPIIGFSGNGLGTWCLVVANHATGIENSGKNIWGVMKFLD